VGVEKTKTKSSDMSEGKAMCRDEIPANDIRGAEFEGLRL
jgi:hypothetical protein